MKKFERYIYIGDIHGRKQVIDKIKEYDDGKTFFVFLGDIFDRGKYSYYVFKTIEEFIKKGKGKLVLGNHDLFFIFTFGIRTKSSEIYEGQFMNNQGKKTIDSFKKEIKYKQKKNKSELAKYMNYVANFLFENGDLYFIDELNNLSIHGGIPFFFDGQVVGDFFEKEDGKNTKEFLYGLDYVKKLNQLLKIKDERTIRKFTAIYHNKEIVENNNKYFNKNYDEMKDSKNYTQFLPTWYLNRNYEINSDIFNGLCKELERHNINLMFCGHDSKYNETQYNFLTKKNENMRILRLDGGKDVFIAIIENGELEEIEKIGLSKEEEMEIIKRIIEVNEERLSKKLIF